MKKIVTMLGAGMLTFALSAPTAASDRHHQSGSGMSGQAHMMSGGHDAGGASTGGADHETWMREVHEKIDTLRDHSKMMEELSEQGKLDGEMKTHMRMMDDMIELMMRAHMAPPPATSGGNDQSHDH
jgi:hypothetical protein